MHFRGDKHLRLCHVRHLVPGHPHMPVTHRTRSNPRFFDRVSSPDTFACQKLSTFTMYARKGTATIRPYM